MTKKKKHLKPACSKERKELVKCLCWAFVVFAVCFVFSRALLVAWNVGGRIGSAIGKKAHQERVEQQRVEKQREEVQRVKLQKEKR